MIWQIYHNPILDMVHGSKYVQPKVSIVTPFYNASMFLGNAIESVLNQSYHNWELLLVNDGSTDGPESVIDKYPDERIRYLKQENQGVAAARNHGLSIMSGEYFCFLDADDIFPPNSLKARMERFKEVPELSFVDGQVLRMDLTLTKVQRKWVPDFNGNPLSDLVRLTGKSFAGATWMVKRRPEMVYQMEPGLTHSEDLLFYLKLARDGGLYGYTVEPTLIYRNRPFSAMKNLDGLERGYRQVYYAIKGWQEVNPVWLNEYRARTKRVLFRSFVRKGRLKKAFNIFARWAKLIK